MIDWYTMYLLANCNQPEDNGSVILMKFKSFSPRCSGDKPLSQNPNGDQDHDQDSGLVVEKAKPKLKPPPMYKVILLNDDYTPMEFVVQVLEYFFSMNREKATQIMLHVHRLGRGVCGIYSREVAETKVAQVNEYSRSHKHPLLCTMEEA